MQPLIFARAVAAIKESAIGIAGFWIESELAHTHPNSFVVNKTVAAA
jgi:hypothetical protein